jgi:uncharacterized membrane protein HdeD (DUF308 family)
MADAASYGLSLLHENWWAIALRGAIGIVIGVVAFLLPFPTLVALVWLFGAYAFLDGVFSLVAVWRRGMTRSWWMMILEGILGIATGIMSFVWPGIIALALVYVIAAWAVVTGVLEIAAAIRLRKEIEGEWLLGLSGALSITLGGLFAVAPDVGAVTLVWLWGAYAAVFGIILLWLGFRLRSRNESAKAQRFKAAA